MLGAMMLGWPLMLLVSVASGQDFRIPNFDGLIQNHYDSYIAYMTTQPITADQIRSTISQHRKVLWLWNINMYRPRNDTVSYTTFMQSSDDLKRYVNITKVYKNDIKVLQIYCPGKVSWDTLDQLFSTIQQLPNLRLLRLDCPIRKISRTFLKGNSKLLYLDLQINIKTFIDPYAFAAVPTIKFLRLKIPEYPSSKITFDILCPLHNNLEWLSTGGLRSTIMLCKNKHFDRVKMAFISDDSIHRLNNNTSTHFRNLEHLVFSAKHLSYIEPRAFDNFKMLKTLAITKGNLGNTNIPDIFQSVPQITSMDLHNDKLSNIDGSFTDTYLYLRLNNNKIKEIHNKTFVKCVHLIQLSLSNNIIRVINSDTFQSTYNIKALKLSRNVINRLEQGCFANLFQVEVIDLSHNLLTNIADNIFIGVTTSGDSSFSKKSRRSIRCLDFSHNLITHINKDAFNFPMLNQLLLNNNNIRKLSYHLFDKLIKLSGLNLSHNQISHLSPYLFSNLVNLHILDLSHNRIQYIPNNIFQNLPLQRLYLSSNIISTLPCDMLAYNQPHICPSALKYLSLQNNTLTNSALCVLSYSPCPLLKYAYLSNVMSLSLNNNSFKFINSSILDNLTSLRTVNFDNNPFQCSCDLLPFASWLASHKSIVQNSASYSCTTKSGVSYSLATLKAHLDCTITIHNYKVIISLCVVIVLSVTLCIVCVCFRMELAALLYAKTGLRLKRHNPEFADKRYNVMIWCHDRDIRYASQLIQGLERYFTVYWNQRDCMPGEPIERGFEKGVMSSERVIVIITRNFVMDYHCQLKFESLHISLGNRDFSAVFIVADDDVITHKQRIYSRVRGYVRTRQYLSHNDILFWKKLLYKLPPRAEDAEPVLYGDLVIPHIDFNGQRSLGDMLHAPDNVVVHNNDRV